MSKLVRIGAAAVMLLTAVVACEEDPVGPEPEVFVATLTAAEGVQTDASGAAEFTFDGTTVDYEITVADISNITNAHIHLGETGGVLVPLPPLPGTDGVDFTGVMAEGSFTDADFDHEELTFEDLIDLMGTGGVYVNVHTSDGEDPPNTGPGDFPGGEISGQITSQ